MKLVNEYRVATAADMVEGATVYCYYVHPWPNESNIGTLGPVDSQGWADVYAADGSRVGYFNAERLAVKRRDDATEDASERRRRFQLFAAHGVPIERNPYTPDFSSSGEQNR